MQGNFLCCGRFHSSSEDDEPPGDGGADGEIASTDSCTALITSFFDSSATKLAAGVMCVFSFTTMLEVACTIGPLVASRMIVDSRSSRASLSSSTGVFISRVACLNAPLMNVLLRLVSTDSVLYARVSLVTRITHVSSLSLIEFTASSINSRSSTCSARPSGTGLEIFPFFPGSFDQTLFYQMGLERVATSTLHDLTCVLLVPSDGLPHHLLARPPLLVVDWSCVPGIQKKSITAVATETSHETSLYQNLQINHM